MMTFNEAVQAMLAGKKVKRVSTTGFDYVTLDKDDDVVCSNGNLYTFNRKDFIADWEIASVPAAGTLLTRYGKTYRLIKETYGNYAILNEETYIEEVKGITEENLVHDLWCHDFDIVD